MCERVGMKLQSVTTLCTSAIAKIACARPYVPKTSRGSIPLISFVFLTRMGGSMIYMKRRIQLISAFGQKSDL
jgi:hypothetical protein